MDSASRKEQIQLIERLLAQGSSRLSFASGLPATGVCSKSALWARFERVKLDGKMCQVLRCKTCCMIFTHRTGTAYDRSEGRSSGTTPLARHICPKGPQGSQPPITAVMKKPSRTARNAVRKDSSPRPSEAFASKICARSALLKGLDS